MANLTEKIKKGLREFGLTSLAVDNRTSILLLTVMILLFGISSYNNMPKESFPEVDWPEIYINTPYFGNSAEDIENLITRPLEKELASISELKKLKSSSLQDFSIITAEFDTDVEMDEAVRKVKDAVDIPVLRKDFIVDEFQIYEAYVHGADCVLLIVSILGEKTRAFVEKTHSLGMECLVEVHGKEEVPYALESGARLIGINNRNLDTLEVNLDTTMNLLEEIPADTGRAVREYLERLDDEAFGGASPVMPKFISPSDPASQWTGAMRGPAFFAYADNYLIDNENAVIVDDVHAFPGHIACDANSRSELVVPLLVDNVLVGVLDIDSPSLDRFSAADQAGVESLCRAYCGLLSGREGFI